MTFDLNGYISRIISNVRNNGVQPCTYHVYSHADGKGSTLHLGYKLAENTAIDFNYNTKSQDGCILLSVQSDLLTGCLANQLTVECAAFSDVEEPLACDDLMTQREVLQFVRRQWGLLNGES